MTIIEILLETVMYYYKNPVQKRSLWGEENECVYENETGQMCAIGRCMIPETRKKYLNLKQIGLEELLIKEGGSIDTILLDAYKGHPMGFWSDLQALHDDQIFWVYTNADFLRKQYIQSMVERWIPIEERIKRSLV
jgi:hypothetical protein